MCKYVCGLRGADLTLQFFLPSVIWHSGGKKRDSTVDARPCVKPQSLISVPKPGQWSWTLDGWSWTERQSTSRMVVTLTRGERGDGSGEPSSAQPESKSTKKPVAF